MSTVERVARSDEPPSPPPKSYRGTTHRRVHQNPEDKHGKISKCNGCGSTDHWFPKCENPDKYDYRRKFASSLQRRINKRPDRPDRKTWRDVSAYMTQNLDVSADTSPQPHDHAVKADNAYSDSIGESDSDEQSSVQSGDDAIDVHSHFTVSQDLSTFYGKFSEQQGLKQDLYSMGLTTDSEKSSQEAFHGRRH